MCNYKITSVCMICIYSHRSTVNRHDWLVTIFVTKLLLNDFVFFQWQVSKQKTCFKFIMKGKTSHLEHFIHQAFFFSFPQRWGRYRGGCFYAVLALAPHVEKGTLKTQFGKHFSQQLWLALDQQKRPDQKNDFFFQKKILEDQSCQCSSFTQKNLYQIEVV